MVKAIAVIDIVIVNAAALLILYNHSMSGQSKKKLMWNNIFHALILQLTAVKHLLMRNNDETIALLADVIELKLFSFETNRYKSTCQKNLYISMEDRCKKMMRRGYTPPNMLLCDCFS